MGTILILGIVSIAVIQDAVEKENLIKWEEKKLEWEDKKLQWEGKNIEWEWTKIEWKKIQ